MLKVREPVLLDRDDGHWYQTKFDKIYPSISTILSATAPEHKKNGLTRKIQKIDGKTNLLRFSGERGDFFILFLFRNLHYRETRFGHESDGEKPR